jgi:hypothetical protein
MMHAMDYDTHAQAIECRIDRVIFSEGLTFDCKHVGRQSKTEHWNRTCFGWAFANAICDERDAIRGDGAHTPCRERDTVTVTHERR